ncbi:Ig-like domain-containing protein [Aeromicrobium sp.]|uniref:Ig-like domain-containing protein n=1 Tax=Aeromicrobium sp. TaxID=1871063 RepID=UPI0030BE85CD
MGVIRAILVLLVSFVLLVPAGAASAEEETHAGEVTSPPTSEASEADEGADTGPAPEVPDEEPAPTEPAVTDAPAIEAPQLAPQFSQRAAPVGILAAPVATDDVYSVASGASLNVFAPGVYLNDVGVPDEPGQFVVENDVDHGTLGQNYDGGFVYDSDDGFTGTDTFTYHFVNPLDEVSSTATVTITVVPLDSAAKDDAYSFPTSLTTFSTNFTDGVHANDVGTSNQPVTVVDGVDHGTLVVHGFGGFDYTPDPGYIGFDSFTYNFVPIGGTEPTNTATVTIQVRPLQAVAEDDNYTTPIDTALNVPPPGVLANDTPGFVFFDVVDDVQHGTLAQGFDGNFLYEPDAGFEGYDTFTYRLVDNEKYDQPSNTATVRIKVGNPPPVAVDDEFEIETCEFNGTPVLPNDPDREVESQPTVVKPVEHGSLIPFGTSFIYAPEDGYVGDDTFTYFYVVDGQASNTATATIHVMPCSDGGDDDGGDEDGGSDSPPEPGADLDDSDQVLPDTGARLPLWMLGLALASVSLGGVLVRKRTA